MLATHAHDLSNDTLASNSMAFLLPSGLILNLWICSILILSCLFLRLFESLFESNKVSSFYVLFILSINFKLGTENNTLTYI